MSNIIEEAYLSSSIMSFSSQCLSSLPLMESTPLVASVEMSASTLETLNQSIDLLDLDNQPNETAEITHENILLVSNTLVDSDDTMDVSENVTNRPGTSSIENESANLFLDRPATPPSIQKRAQKPVRLPLQSAGQAQDDGDIFDQSLVNEINLEKIVLNQKGNPQLIIRDEEKLRCMNIQAAVMILRY